MTSRQKQFLSTRNGSNWWRMVKVHQMHHVGAIEKHMNITSDQLLSMLQHVCSEETSKIICPNLTLPQAGFHLMWFSDLPEYADATRRSKRKGEKPATTLQQPASGWVGVFPVSLFLFGGAHVSWVGMGWLSKNDWSEFEHEWTWYNAGGLKVGYEVEKVSLPCVLTIGIIGPVNMVVCWLTVFMLITLNHLADSRDASPYWQDEYCTSWMPEGCKELNRTLPLSMSWYYVILFFFCCFHTPTLGVCYRMVATLTRCIQLLRREPDWRIRL